MTRVVAVATATLWTGPEAPRPLDAAALATPSDVRGWTAAMTDADRLDLHGRVESQALLGDPAVIDEERDGWSRVVLPGQPSSHDARGYPGWLPTAQLADWE
ncbi:MAG: peptidase, partial [Actinomycetota bacterium]|nr:peptidase [Actinomycetota bacterium]